MSRLILIRGNSGSGKSTIAKRLQKELGYGTMLIPQDVVRRDILRTHDTPGNVAIGLTKSIATYGRDIGYDVIVEGIFTRSKYEKMLIEIMQLFEEVYVYYFAISFDETLRRHKTKSNSHEFGEDDMREWYIDNDILEVAGEIRITDTLSEDEILAKIIQDVQKGHNS